MKAIHLAIAIAALCAWMGPAVAQNTAPNSPQPITLDQALEIAFKNNPNIKIAVDQINRSRAAAHEAMAGFMPKFNGEYQITEQGPPVIVSFPPYIPPSVFIPATQRTAIASVALPLDINGSITYTNRIARDQFQIDYLGMLHTSEQIIFDVKSAYYDLLRAQAQADVDQAAVDVAQERLKNTTAQFNAGTVPKFDMDRAQVDVANLNQTLIQGKTNVEQMRGALNRVLGIDVNAPTVVAKSELPIDTKLKIDIPEGVKTAFVQRPEVKQQQIAIKAARSNIRLQRTGIYPALNLSGNFTHQFQLSGFSTVNDSWIAVLALTFPIWDAGVTHDRVDEAKADASKSNDTLDQLKLSVALEVRAAALRVQEALDRVRTTAENVSLAEESLRLANVRYNAGISVLVEVLDAENALTQARFNNVNAIYDYTTGIADLQRATATQPEIAKLQLLPCKPIVL